MMKNTITVQMSIFFVEKGGNRQQTLNKKDVSTLTTLTFTKN